MSNPADDDYMEKPRTTAELADMLRKMGGFLIQVGYSYRLAQKCGPSATLNDAFNVFFAEFEEKLEHLQAVKESLSADKK